MWLLKIDSFEKINSVTRQESLSQPADSRITSQIFVFVDNKKEDAFWGTLLIAKTN